MREQLQAFADELDAEQLMYSEWIAKRIRKILTQPPPAVSVKPGWVCKDRLGLSWHDSSPKPEWCKKYRWWKRSQFVTDVITDPWPDKPNGGPECVMEVKP